jgi:hypothetical protein
VEAVALWFGAALLPHLVNHEFHIVPENYSGECEAICQKAEAEPYWILQQDNDPKHTAKVKQNVSKRRNVGLWNGRVKAQISILSKCCGWT